MVWENSREPIFHPFYARGGLDKGLGLHRLANPRADRPGLHDGGRERRRGRHADGSSRLALRALDPLFQVLRTVPTLARLPLSLVAFREAQPFAVFVVFVSAAWPIVIDTAVGVRDVPRDYHDVARVLRLSGPAWFLRIVVPAAAPHISPARGSPSDCPSSPSSPPRC